MFQKVRFREPKAVVEEMHALVKQGKKLLYLADSNFSVSRQHVLSVCKEVRKQRPNVQLFAEMAVEFTDKEMLRAMAESRFAGVTFGIESLNETCLKEIGKTGASESYRRKAQALLSYCNEIGLKCSCYYIAPLRHQDKSTILNEIKFLQTFGQVELMFLTPYPGTRLWDEAKDMLITRDLSKYDSYHIVYNPSQMSQNELAEIYQHTVRYNRAQYAGKQKVSEQRSTTDA
jgi:bacteriochlorophyll C12 methyltransferase